MIRSNATGVIGIPSRIECAYVREKIYNAIDAIISKVSMMKTMIIRLFNFVLAFAEL